MDHPGPGAGSTGPPRRRGVVQTESARNRLKRTLRGSDRRSAEVGPRVDQWTTPRRIFLLAGWTGPRRLAEGRRPTTPQPGSCGGCVGGDDDTYFKKRKQVVQWSSPARPPRIALQSGAIALTGDLRSPTSGPPPLVQGGPGWSSLVQGGPAGPVGVQPGRALPAGRQRGALGKAGCGIEPRRA